ncbi:MAG: hypothetical protein GY749_49010, partial [Desulfobacteraceae bacterium]|nr:hypothetical protein [Desulfobacteraceae bacterium]
MIVNNTATVSAEVVYDGGSTVTDKGVCWSISEISDMMAEDLSKLNCTHDGNGIGIFNSQITGLKYNSTYYVRAYA